MAVAHTILAPPTLAAPAAASLARSVKLDPATAAGAKPATDLKTMKEVWRTYTIPAKGEPGSESWKDDHNAAANGGHGVPSRRCSRLPPDTYSSSRKGSPPASPTWSGSSGRSQCPPRFWPLDRTRDDAALVRRPVADTPESAGDSAYPPGQSS